MSSSPAAAPSSLDLAAEVLGGVEGEAQVSVVHERSLVHRFSASAPTQATDIDARTVHVLCVVEGHTGAASATTLDRDTLGRAARRARLGAEAAARSGAGRYPGLPTPAPAPGHDGWDAATAALDPAVAGEALGAAFGAAAERDLDAFGVWTAGDVETAVVSTAGTEAIDRVTDAYMKVLCRDDDGRSGYAAATAVRADAIDAAAIAAAAAQRVPRGEPVAVDAAELPVVLDHDAVGTLLDMLAGSAFNGLAHVEERGALSGKLGTRVAAPSISLSDSPRFAGTLPRAFDAEGVPKAPIALIEDGTACAVVHDTRTAALAGHGARSTGHALAPGGSPWGAMPTNLVLAGGDAPGLEALCAPVERGLFVTRVWYVNVVHERSSLMTGVTRDGTFLIEDGRISRPARDVRFTDSVLRLLAATEALTSAQRLASEADFYGTRYAHGVVCPALRAQGFRITGGA